MLCGRGRKADAGVCACLGIVDQGFDTERELEILKDTARELQWANEYNRRTESTGSRDIANDPVSGVNSHPTAIYTADPLGDTDVAAGETNPGTENHVVYVVDTLGNVTTATKPSSSVAADTPQIQDNAAALLSQPSNDTPNAAGPSSASLSTPSNDTSNAAGPSSSTITKIGVKTQNTPELKGQDEVGKMSKSQKKRENRKQAKARAKDAAANAEDSVGNDDNDDKDGDVPSSVPH